MKALGKKAATAAAAVITASAIAYAPSVQPPAPEPVAAPAIRLAADVQLAPTAFNPFSVTDWVGRIVIPPSLGAAFPAPPSPPPPVINPQNIDSTVKSIYFAVEPWVHYGFQLAQYAVGWIPWVGWLAPQVDIFYHLGERIVRSAIFNTTEWLTGQGSFIDNLGQFGVDTINSFIFFTNDQLAFWLPPLPPIPPIGPLSATTATLTTPDETPLLEPLRTVERRVGAPVDLAGTALRLPDTVDAGRLAAARVLDITGLKPAEAPTTGTISPSTGTPVQSAGTSNPLRKIDPFNITRDVLTPFRDTTTVQGSRKPLLDAFDVTKTPVGTTNPLVGTTNPSLGTTKPSVNPSRGRLADALKGRVNDALSGRLTNKPTGDTTNVSGATK